jgi:lipoprotein-releasing system permease protein
MRYELFISLRYLKAKRKNRFISIITLISVAGVLIGVMALIIVLAVMNGFESDLRNRILGTYAHIQILSEEGEGISNYESIISRLERTEDVLGAAPYVYGQGMLVSGKEDEGVVIKGIVPGEEKKVSKLSENIAHGTFHFPESNSILIGIELARRLGLSLEAEVTLIPPLLVDVPWGKIPKFEIFKISGIFESGMYEYDSSLVYISLSAAQKLFGLGERVSGVEIKLDDIYSAPRVAKKIGEKLVYPLWAKTWMEAHRNLFSALKLEKVTMFIILVLIILVAAFNIASTLIMVVMEKTRDIGILKSMGATRGSIRAIFTLEGLIIGAIGTVLGCLGGFFACKALAEYQFIKLPSDIYYINTLPVQIRAGDFLYISLFALAISLLATIYPAYQASRLKPVEALRYE